MIIDPIDLKILRHLESQGYAPINDIISKFHISRDEIFLRIRNFEEQGLISRYGIKLFIPAITGGKWYRGCAFVDADVEPDVSKVYPLTEEMIVNVTLPSGILPSYSYFFYSRDLKYSYRLLNKTPGVKYVEVYKIAEHNIQIPHELSREEWQLIYQFVQSKINFARIHEIIDNPSSETDVRLARLILSRNNQHGIFSIFPSINWGLVKNFAHIHLGITTRMRPNELKRFLKHHKIPADIFNKFKKKYLQLEFDLWGFSDMNRIIDLIKKERRITIHCISIANRNEICDDWFKNFIKEKAR
ncbi:MAG: Lrp/AsnC family transcriptional regulator [candidate division WOR-3 bacterium]|nr:Lrp/AsnC family transcriptional regulator [candidate division WOR-3 bacterium]